MSNKTIEEQGAEGAQIPDGCAYCGALPCDQVVKPSDIWQPIETAPKRGDIMLYCEETGEQFVAYWGTDPIDGDQQWVFAWSPEISFIVRDPTHWAPCLPPPIPHQETSSDPHTDRR